jgi:hypothetical protein
MHFQLEDPIFERQDGIQVRCSSFLGDALQFVDGLSFVKLGFWIK